MGSYSRKRYATESASFPKSASSAPGSYSYENFADLPASGSTPGNTAFVVATNKLYIWSGVGWYLIATVTNASPTAITGVNGSYDLAIDGSATTITAVSTDPEGFALTWSYAVSSGSLGSTATVSQADNVFTITPSTNSAHVGTFSLTFSVTDGVNGVVSAVSAFTLSFIVQNSRYTALSVKATNTGSNQTFDDASTSNHTITASGDVTASTFSPYRAGGYSAYFDNPTVWSYLRLPDTTLDNICNDTTASAIATHVTTIEAWVYPLSRRDSFSSAYGGGSCILTKGYIWFNLGIDHDGYVHCYHMSGGSGNQSGAGYTENNIITSNTVPLNAWTHVAAVIENSQIKVYVNGVLGASGTWNGLHNYASGSSRQSSIGAGVTSADGPRRFDGYICDFRISDNARYTSNFTQSTEFLTVDSDTDFLLGNLPYFKDQSASNHAITVTGNVSLEPKSVFDNAPYSEASHGASAYFDGTNDHISAANHADFNVGSSDFTLECWAYIESTTSNGGICGLYNTSTNQRSYIIHQTDTSNHFGVAMSSNGTFESGSGIDSNVDIIEYLNQWVHLALTKSGTNATLYLNGNSIGTTSSAPSTLHASTGEFVVGKLDGANVHTTGYVSDVRLVNGTAVYTSNFTPPAAPLTAVTNAKLLLNPETSISDLSQSSTITCFDNTVTSTTQVKFAGTKSIAFDGAGDYLVPSSAAMNIPASTEFTIEGWVYFTGIGSYEMLFGGTGTDPYIGLKSSSWELEVILGASGSTHTFFPWQPNNNIWYYITVVRNSSNIIKLWIDGVEVTATSGSTNSNALSLVNIGRAGGYTQHDFQGYMQDVRITKGLARYTANFTPPTAELQG